MRLIRQACDASMPRKKPWNDKREAYWWTPEIVDLRRESLKHRRKTQRRRNRPETAEKTAQYKEAKRALRRTIQKNKANYWQKLCDDLNRDFRRKGYELVARKLGAPIPTRAVDTETMNKIMGALFPTHPRRDDGEYAPTDMVEIPLLTKAKLVSVVRSMKNRKAPGPNDIPAEMIKVVTTHYPQLLLHMYEYLAAGIFPARWKVVRLALISKEKGNPDSP